MKKIVLLIFLIGVNLSLADEKKPAEIESLRFLRAACEQDKAFACALYGNVIQEERPEKAKEVLQKACNMGECILGYEPKIEIDTSMIVKYEDEILKGAFQIDVVREPASVTNCYNLAEQISACQFYRCIAPHALTKEEQIIHSIVREKDYCYYTQQRENNLLFQCRLTMDQTSLFENMTSLEVHMEFEKLLDQKVCILRPID